ncbi:hypothetical protein [Mesorhizobium sp. LNJC391B00]|uniref:hypothetical protein n=1 Tax=Mesorhizobium sp. LNJC391B00 TaxID=1287273 RepID=UPI0003CEDDEA|nr:hypothetical protein [Mesorhizobium sp. LNJC391B00]ESY21532.1 hypothetical protein X749_27975 [Mesorhizobium sp. LNJC391B00]
MDLTNKQSLAMAAAAQAAEAIAELLRYAREGEWMDYEFHPDVEPLEKLCDAAKLVAEILSDQPDPDGDRNQVAGALEKFLAGWA